MSDSDDIAVASRKPPSKATIEKGLRAVIVSAFKEGDTDELTLKRIRAATEKKLRLEDGFFKNSAKWKTESESIIRDEINVQEQGDGASTQQSQFISPKKPKRGANSKPKPVKRASPDDQSRSSKRQKKLLPELDSNSSALSDQSDGSAEPKKMSKKRVVESDNESEEHVQPNSEIPENKNSESGKIEDSESELSSLIDESPEPIKTKKATSNVAKKGKKVSKTAKTMDLDDDDDDESEMSEVIDEPPKRKRQKSSEAPAKRPRKKAAVKGKEAPELPPDEAEIKRLQGWLVKCGVRKLWHKELAPYDTPKTKINHLKGILKDIGMEGRFSVEKAKQIKEEREFKADLEEIQDGAQRWGKDEESDESGGKPRRRLARGLKSLQSLMSDQSDDGEESD